MNHYGLLAELDQEDIENYKVGCSDAGLGDGFNYVNELHVMKYKEATIGPDDKAWKQEVQNKHEWIMKYEVWRPVKKVGYQKEQKY